MSAQDDLLAAFGEPPRRRDAGAGAGEGVLPAEAGEMTEVAEADAEVIERAEADGEAGVSEQASEFGEVGPTGGEAGVSEQASEFGEVGPTGGEAGIGGQAPEFAGAGPAGAPQISMPIDTTPPQPYLDPAAFFAQLQAEAAPKPKRRWPRLLLRYASALVVAGALGAGTAYAVTLPRRTDVPFLATPADGRYTFPAMVRPAPPVGMPAPGADSNSPQTHYNDLRQYLLPAPIGAVPKEDGWESVADFDSSLTGTDAANHLYDEGLRHIARRGWSTPDGQHTVVELLQFPDHQAAFAVQGMLDSTTPKKAGQQRNVVPQLTVPSFGDATFNVALRTFDAVDGLPGQKERRVVFGSGDVIAIVTATAPGTVPDVPTEQVVLLEAQMLR